MTSYCTRSANASRSSSRLLYSSAWLPNPTAHLAVCDRESDLGDLWERSEGRTLYGRAGAYRVLRPGKRNGGPGPDFLGAVVAFPNGSVRQGDVELHLEGAGWVHHGHQWDGRYGHVMLHVVAYGTLAPVCHTQLTRVPTVHLPLNEPGGLLPCEVGPAPLKDFTEHSNFLAMLAGERWYRRLGSWQGRPLHDQLALLAHRLGPQGRRLDLAGFWQGQLPASDDLVDWLGRVVEQFAPACLDGAGQRRLGRVVILSALAFQRVRQPEQLRHWDWDEIKAWSAALAAGEYAAPSRDFLVEVVGNWLYPLQAADTGRDLFDYWYRLPRGWTYGRVKRLVQRLCLPTPHCFGEQQGLLEWLESLCREQACEGCPVTGTMSKNAPCQAVRESAARNRVGVAPGQGLNSQPL